MPTSMYLSRLQLNSLFSKQRIIQQYATQSKCRRHISSSNLFQLQPKKCTIIENQRLKSVRTLQLSSKFPYVVSSNTFSTSSYRLKDDKGKDNKEVVAEESKSDKKEAVEPEAAAPTSPAENAPVSIATEDLKALIAQISAQLTADRQLSQKELEDRLEELNLQFQPLQEVRDQIQVAAAKRTKLMMWGGLAFMATQFGVLARLTWWEYSWDIMEPVTYFVTTGTAIVCYGYFLLTQQDLSWPDARDRQHLRLMHKAAGKKGFDVEKYNKLLAEIAETQSSLEKLKKN